jgi:beta-galactosidase
MGRQIGYDARALTVNGQRRLLISGAIHYPRSTPEMWPDLMKRSAAAGLNAIETYVFWNLHEQEQGVYDFADRLDLRRFCELAQAHGLDVILRIGPYICAETNYGGFPAWLREVPGVRTRTWNEPFMREMERWVRFVADYMRPYFAPAGGPIIAAQIENEYNLIAATYGEDGQRYRQWAADLGNSLGLGVPWIMCVGGAAGAIETINGFLGHTQLDRHWEEHPDQPAIWTENWTGWYDSWGYPHHVRTSEHVAYGVARFVAAGGTGVNYYMWHGGTNFGREAMYLQTTSYDYDAPLDEFGFVTTKAKHLGRLNRLLREFADVLVGAGRPRSVALGPGQVAYDYGALAFLCNDDETASARVTWGGESFDLPRQSVSVVQGAKVLFETAAIAPEDMVVRAWEPVASAPLAFGFWPEPVPGAGTTAGRLVGALSLTHDRTDYCWYTTRFTAVGGGSGVLSLDGVADVVYVFVDGQPAGSTALPLPCNRGPVGGDDWVQSFALDVEPGEHELTLLCCAVGLIKGDWQIGMQNMADEAKGLFGEATWDGEALPGPWAMAPGLVGEKAGVYGEAGALVAWAPGAGADRPLAWWRAEFARPAGAGPLVVDLSGMTKGLAWVNGRCLGRYWLLPGHGESEGGLRPVVQCAREGEPTQRYYHIPADWLEERNVLVLFEEAGGDPVSIRLLRPAVR